MQKHHAELLAMVLAGQEYKPSIAESAFYTSREAAKPIGREKTTLRKPLPGQSLMIPQLLRSGIFALSKKTASDQRRVPKFDDVSDTSQGASVEYKGERLRQYDMRVLLGLMQIAGGLHCDEATFTFHADNFLALIGKKVSTDAVEALRDSLANLRSATFVVRNFSKDKGFVFGFVNDATWKKRQCTVTLSPLAHKAFEALGFTLLPITVRNHLADGFETAMADIIYSTSTNSFDVDALAALFGRPAVQFGRELRAHMPALVEAGVLEAWSHTRGRIHVERVPIRAYSRKSEA